MAETASTRDVSAYVPDLAELAKPQSSELRELVERYVADRGMFTRFYSVEGSLLSLQKQKAFYTGWRDKLVDVPFDTLSVEGRIDYVLLSYHLEHEIRVMMRTEKRNAEMGELVPFADEIARLQEARRQLEPVDSQEAAKTLEHVETEIEALRKGLRAGLHRHKADQDEEVDEKIQPLHPNKVIALRAANRIDGLRDSLEDWFKQYDGYDPLFTWWNREVHGRLIKSLDAYQKILKEDVIGFKPDGDDPIVGDPLGRDELLADLKSEMIAYTPEEIVEIANHEFVWCEDELKKVSREMGFGDDWKAALEKVKKDYVEPGHQPDLVRDFAREAIDYVDQNKLVTVPPIAGDEWRLRMMPAVQQKVAPFFLGGESILVAYPTDQMPFDDKLMSLRANNVHFARATVFHELFPGHGLQSFYNTRYQPQRQLFRTPFWIEGWSLWWEFLFYDRGFPKSPEDRIGMLFWRSHRCARIIFSLNFHLGRWTPQQCIDFLVERVGHERASATGEVRRSFNGSYAPLYQVAYMLGGLQFRAIHRELVESGKMKDQAFHDTILRGNTMPIELVRVRLRSDLLKRDFKPTWRFAEP